MDKLPSSDLPEFDMIGLGQEQLLDLYRSMLRIRKFEEKIRHCLEQGNRITTPCHLCIGQEAAVVGVCANLATDDYLFGNHRSHGHYLAKGGDLNKAMAEVFCRKTGCSHGRGGSMHLISKQNGLLGTSSIVAGSVPLAVGAGLGVSVSKKAQISVIFHGDGVPEEGAWNESANFAAINHLPVLFVCENNLYCTHLSLEERRTKDNLPELARAHGLRSSSVDGNNVLAVFSKARQLVDSIRQGEGPAFLECRTYRWFGHVGPKDDLRVGLRSPAEVEAWRRRCPIRAFEQALLEKGGVDRDVLRGIHRDVQHEIDLALDFAQRSRKPDPEELRRHVYKTSASLQFPEATEPPENSLRELTYVEAIREAQYQQLEADPKAFIMGQGVDSPWCVGQSTRGLLNCFGKERVRDVPISENTMTGAAIGAAMVGMHPLVFHPRMDFMYLAMDQIINHCAFWYYMFGGQVNVPVVIRSIINRRGEQGSQHSQSPYAMYAHVPGLKVVMPATPYDAKGLLLAAFADENPVLFIDDRCLYAQKGMVPEAPYSVPLAQGNVIQEGTDLTIVAISSMVHLALTAAKELATQGIQAEIIDPRTIKPLDLELILASVEKTGRLLVADPAWPRCGVASDIAAQVSSHLFGLLKAPVRTITFPDTPIPASRVLEDEFYPTADDIMLAAGELLAQTPARAA